MLKARSLLILVSMIGACAAEPNPAEPLGLDDDKSDGFGEDGKLLRSGEFLRDFQIDQFGLQLVAGAELSVRITRTGTARDLDTRLWVHSSKGETLGYDDDAGWKDHSSIAKVTVPEDDLVQFRVATDDLMGRGKYRLEIACLSDACVAPPVSCPVATHEAVADLYDTSDLADYYDGRPGKQLEIMLDDVETLFGVVCDLQRDDDDDIAASASTVCDDGIEAFEERTLPACDAELRQNWPDTIDMASIFPDAAEALGCPEWEATKACISLDEDYIDADEFADASPTEIAEHCYEMAAMESISECGEDCYVYGTSGGAAWNVQLRDQQAWFYGAYSHACYGYAMSLVAE